MEPDLLPQQPPETTYHLVLEGTIRGKTKLVTNTGYTYNIRKRRPNGTIDWQCTVRRKDHRCKASVIMQGGTFCPGMHDHNHPGEFGVLASTQIQARVKQVNNSPPSAEAVQLYQWPYRQMLKTQLTNGSFRSHRPPAGGHQI